jgi:hypothetical protein
MVKENNSKDLKKKELQEVTKLMLDIENEKQEKLVKRKRERELAQKVI